MDEEPDLEIQSLVSSKPKRIEKCCPIEPRREIWTRKKNLSDKMKEIINDERKNCSEEYITGDIDFNLEKPETIKGALSLRKPKEEKETPWVERNLLLKYDKNNIQSQCV